MKVNDLEREINRTRNTHDIDRLNTVSVMLQAYVSCHHEDDKMIVFERGSLLWVFNFHSTKSFADYRVGASIAGKYPLSQHQKYEFTVFICLYMLSIVLCFLSYVLKGEPRTIFVKLSHGHFKV